MSNTDNYNKLFVGGDLSGIQKFLYNITSKKAAVSLKGRSFYLREYMESKCDELTRLSSIAKSNPEVIYCSGGKFYVIVQNSSEVQDALKEYARRIKAEIWKEHKGQLSINLSWVPFSENADKSINANGQTSQKLGFLWQCITEDFARQKNQKFLEEIKENYEEFFNVIPVGGKPKVCAVTGIESDDLQPLVDDEEGKTIYVLKSVKKQIEKGMEIAKVEKTKSFEEYAKDDNGDATYLGILRMDVDGLGKAFADSKDLQTFDEYTAFSNHLDQYFTSRPDKNHVSNLEIIHQKSYKKHMNILYAGGDDIFVVGRWDKIIEFAEEVRNDFVDYIKKDDISISGGIAIVHPKFPIAKAAEMAGEAEDMAKAYEKEGKPRKNAFCMFGRAISWDGEFTYVKDYKDSFVSMESKGMPRAILHKIMEYATIVEKNKAHKSAGEPEDFSYLWHSAYYFTRVIDRLKTSNPKVADFCKKLRDKELSGNADNFNLMALAARWAELTIRMKQKQENNE